MNYRYTFTVFTPSYNRARTLPRVYDSLRVQTFRDFEWLVLDDGSTDDTRQLVERWQTESNFPIHYVFQENQGKPAAFNRGVQEAQGELFLSLDSDDACVPNALERFKFLWDGIPESKKDEFSAITVLTQDQNGNLVGDKFPRDVLDSDSIELSFKYAVRGDKWGFQRTEVLRQFPFPNLRFVPEDVVWFALSRRFKTRFVNEILEIIDNRGLDRLSVKGMQYRYAGDALYYRYVLDELMGWLLRSPRNLLLSSVGFSRCSFGLGKGPTSQIRELHSLGVRLLVAISLPVGFVLYHQPIVISHLRHLGRKL
jgi:glycosyltransferase involved in cell wall biosynthesis